MLKRPQNRCVVTQLHTAALGRVLDLAKLVSLLVYVLNASLVEEKASTFTVDFPSSFQRSLEWQWRESAAAAKPHVLGV